LQDLQAIEIVEHKKRGRPRKDAVGEKYYQISGVLAPKDSVIDAERQRAGLFLLATNVLDEQVLSDDEILQEYKAQLICSKHLDISYNTIAPNILSDTSAVNIRIFHHFPLPQPDTRNARDRASPAGPVPRPNL
jgi:hypothetical protein